tara:strand:- start:1078 stop:1758 length:681 start_codon:yes stop_codon:yes gene_type:complete
MLACFTNNEITVPKHLAIIPDGNCRWAKKNEKGYEKSKHVLQQTIQWSCDKGIRELSIFAWSSDHWNRPLSEINQAMHQLESVIDEWIRKEQTDIAFHFISTDKNRLNSTLRAKMDTLKTITEKNNKMVVYIYVSYGFEEDVQQSAENLTYKIASVIPSFASSPDLLIRTSGEKSLSNFCLWHLRTTDIMFIQPLFPDCHVGILDQCIEEYSTRKRRDINMFDDSI